MEFMHRLRVWGRCFGVAILTESQRLRLSGNTRSKNKSSYSHHGSQQ